MIDSLQKKEFMSFIKLLDSNHLLQHVVVIGSWAEFVYKQTGLLPGFEAMTKTTDVDFLLRNRRQPIPKVSLGSIAKDAGYTIAQDYLLQTTKILTPGNLEVEFLICSRGAGSEIVVDTNFGIKAQSLRDMTVILHLRLTDITF